MRRTIRGRGVPLSREDHRIHDILLLAQRALENETVEESEARRRKEKRDGIMAVGLATITIPLAMFLHVYLAGVAGFLTIFCFAAYVGNLDRLVGVAKRKVHSIQAGIMLVGALVGLFILPTLWKEEQAALLEGDLIGAGPIIDDGQKRGFPMLQVGETVWVMGPDGVWQTYSHFFKIQE